MFIACACMPSTMSAQDDLTFKGVKQTMRYDDGEDSHSEYLGWDSDAGKAIFSGDQGLWKMDVKGTTITPSLVKYDNSMYGNSGAFYKRGEIYTIFSHEGEDGEQEFVVRKWDAKTGELLKQKDANGNEVDKRTFPKSANLEARGWAFNPVDGQVYGLFYFTDVALPVPVDSLDQEDQQDGYTTDAGYALATVDLETMEIDPVTPGVYYENFIWLACSPEGRMFSMTSGGSLVEFDTESGLMITKPVIDENGDTIQENVYPHSGVESQFKRQAACFDYTTGKLYWNGYVNSGKGYNDWGSWSSLSDKEWRTNGKYDTALYEVDITTGKATKINDIPNRMTFSCLWIEGRDATDLAPTSVKTITKAVPTGNVKVYTLGGQCVYNGKMDGAKLQKGAYIIRDGKTSFKTIIK